MTKVLYKPLSLIAGVLGGVLAATDRGAAEGTLRLTGFWPGENAGQKKVT